MSDNAVNINYKNKYTFGQMLDKLSEDSTLSFISKGFVYFNKSGEFKVCKFDEDLIYGLPLANKVELTQELVAQSFYETDLHISSLITIINPSEIKKYLQEGYIVLFARGENVWDIDLEDNVVYLDYNQVEGADESNYLSLFGQDMLTGLVDGIWYIIEGSESE